MNNAQRDGVEAALREAVGPDLAGGLDALTWGATDDHLEVRDADDAPVATLQGLRIACGGRKAWQRSAITGVAVPEREQFVELRLAEGRTTTEIADELSVSERTVTTLRKKVRERVDPAAPVTASLGVTVVGAASLARDVVHACLRIERNDVSPGHLALIDDRIRVLVAPSARELASCAGAAIVLIGDLPDGVSFAAAVRQGMMANGSLSDGPQRWRAMVDAVDAGNVALAPDTVRALVLELRRPDVELDLTPRELDVIDGIRRGESVKQTARRLGLTAKTIENRRHQLYARFGVRTAQQLVARVDRTV